jgi:hypothetical protein
VCRCGEPVVRFRSEEIVTRLAVCKLCERRYEVNEGGCFELALSRIAARA